MHKTLLLLIAALHILSGGANAQKAEPNRVIAEAEKNLIGGWLLVEGIPEADAKGERIWSFGRDHNLIDSKEEKGMKYFLVQNAEGEIWMLMLYSLGDSGPMIMRVQVEGDTLKLNHVGETPEGSYGVIRDGGLIFRRQKDGEQAGTDQPATRSESKSEGGGKAQPESKPSPR